MEVVMPSKRRLLLIGGSLAAVAAPALLTRPAFAKEKAGAKSKETGKKDEEVTPPEDLMREHGVLDRVLLLYEAGIRKFSSNEDFDPAMITQSAEIIRDFLRPRGVMHLISIVTP
ncbi:hypothetical protein [Bradyrhizobium sp. NAS80.1]|uniref:hypothetical protein n=1 Tax=Bradyrhizobium sp. NAS80.1 TaxID=1680159 RepID=UPI000A03110E|nr:hypothetical protein [Bradyrhizobium sp. NAS80.1]